MSNFVSVKNGSNVQWPQSLGSLGHKFVGLGDAWSLHAAVRWNWRRGSDRRKLAI